MCSLSPQFILNVLKSRLERLQNKNLAFFIDIKCRAVRTVSYGPLAKPIRLPKTPKYEFGPQEKKKYLILTGWNVLRSWAVFAIWTKYYKFNIGPT